MSSHQYPDNYRGYTTRLVGPDPGRLAIIRKDSDGHDRTVCFIEKRSQWQAFCSALETGANEVSAVHAIDEPEIPSAPRNHPDYVPPSGAGENYTRTDSGELIGPYATADECECERIAANAERADNPFAITLTDEEQDDLTSRIMAGGADETTFDENSGVSRCGHRVVIEHEGHFRCEQFESENRARERFGEIARALGLEDAREEENEPAIERDADGRPIGKCPDCGKPITLQRSGWWTHDGMPEDCWHQSMDGPNDLDTTEPDDHDSPLFLTFKHADGQTISFPVDDVATDVEILRDGSTRINATGAALRDWASEPGNSWPCSELARLRSLHVKLAPNGDLVELGCNLEYKANGERSEVPGDELDAFVADALRAEVIKTALEIEPKCLDGIDGPGKFEGTDRQLAAAMCAIAGVSGEDERAGDVESGGAAWRVDRFVAVEDSQGFVSVEGFRSVPDAEKHAQSFEPDDGDEDDEPTRTELEQFALMQGASREYIADVSDAQLSAKYGEDYASSRERAPINKQEANEEEKATESEINPAPIERTIRRTLTRDLANGSRLVALIELRKDGDRGLSGGFSVTGELYKKHGTWTGKAQQLNGREADAGGCIHAELSKAFPKLAPIIALHLSAEDGTPMHAEANARYWHEQSSGMIEIGETYGREKDRGETREQYCRRLACETLRVESLPPKLDRAAKSARVLALRDGANSLTAKNARKAYRDAFAMFVDAQRARWKAEAIDARRAIEAMPVA